MRITYSKKINAAYIYLKDKINLGEAKKTILLEEALPNTINLDYDNNGILIGIEVIPASILPKELLNLAESIDK